MVFQMFLCWTSHHSKRQHFLNDKLSILEIIVDKTPRLNFQLRDLWKHEGFGEAQNIAQFSKNNIYIYGFILIKTLIEEKFKFEAGNN